MGAQIPDRILYNHEYHNLCTNPLELYWRNLRKRRPDFLEKEDCKRGYLATWEIRNGQLFLREIEGLFRRTFMWAWKKESRYSMARLFGKKKTRVKANWYTGKLRIPTGSMTAFADNGYDSRYSREVIVTVTEGNVDRIVTMDNTNHKLIVDQDMKVSS